MAMKTVLWLQSEMEIWVLKFVFYLLDNKLVGSHTHLGYVSA